MNILSFTTVVFQTHFQSTVPIELGTKLVVSLIMFDLVLTYTDHPFPDSEGGAAYERFNFPVVRAKYLNSYYITKDHN